jgi:hypothetical protein
VAVEALSLDVPRAAYLEDRLVPRRDSGNPGWMDAVVAPILDPSDAVPAVHMAGPVVHSELGAEADDRAALCRGQFAASFFAVHAAARLFVLEAQEVLLARFASVEE